jgi:hypothetical protein
MSTHHSFTCQKNAARFRVQNLELIGLSLASCVAFRKCIPFFTSICKLKITKVQNAKGLNSILHGIKNSRSIREVDTMDDENVYDDDDDVDLTESQLRLIQAYCERNQLLDKLLQIDQPLELEDDDSGAGSKGAVTTDTTAPRTAATTATSVVATELGLRPPLLLAATQQVPSMSWSVVTRGLLVLGQSLGDDGHGGDSSSAALATHS